MAFQYCCAPTTFILRVGLLIFQIDCSAVRGLHFLCQWPARVISGIPYVNGKTMAAHVVPLKDPDAVQGCIGDPDASRFEDQELAKRSRLQDVLLEGDRREHQPFDEYIELLLHFLWISSFAIVWPLGCVFALINQFLEFRFDCAKLLIVRRRRFPCSRHMLVAWVPCFASIVCHISIVVNVLLLLLPYRQLLLWYPEGCQAEWSAPRLGADATAAPESGWIGCTVQKIGVAFIATWVVFMVVRLLAMRLLNEILGCVGTNCQGFRWRSAARRSDGEKASATMETLGMRPVAARSS